MPHGNNKSKTLANNESSAQQVLAQALDFERRQDFEAAYQYYKKLSLLKNPRGLYKAAQFLLRHTNEKKISGKVA